MKRIYTVILILGVAILGTSFIDKGIDLPKNFHQISDEVYRSGQPNKRGMKALEQSGFKTILNLRYRMDDKQEIKKTDMIQIRVPMKAQSITFEEMVITLRFILHAEKPVLIHCLHGSDRTGCVSACYRMVFQGWSKEKAIEELMNPVYGYNYRWFPNIKSFLENLDVEELKERVLFDESH